MTRKAYAAALALSLTAGGTLAQASSNTVEFRAEVVSVVDELGLFDFDLTDEVTGLLSFDADAGVPRPSFPDSVASFDVTAAAIDVNGLLAIGDGGNETNDGSILNDVDFSNSGAPSDEIFLATDLIAPASIANPIGGGLISRFILPASAFDASDVPTPADLQLTELIAAEVEVEFFALQNEIFVDPRTGEETEREVLARSTVVLRLTAASSGRQIILGDTLEFGADLNQDGRVTFNDAQYFLMAYQAKESEADFAAPIGVIDTQDALAYFAQYREQSRVRTAAGIANSTPSIRRAR